MLDRKTSIAAICASNCLGMLSFMSLPLWLGAVISDLGISESLAGRIAAAQLGGMALMALGLSRKVDQLPWRVIGLIAVAMTILGNLCTLFIDNIWYLAAARIVVGMGEGKLLAIGNSAAAGTKEPQKTYSVMTIVLSTAFLVVALGAPGLIEHFGRQGVFGLLLSLELVAAPLLFWFPTRRIKPETGAVNNQNFGLAAFGILCGVGICQMAQALLWAYNGQIGLSVGLSLSRIGQVLALVALITLAGPIAARKLGMKFGAYMPICIALVLMCGAGMLLGYADKLWMYALGTILLPTLGLFASPYTMSILAVLDARGRAAAAAPAFIGIGDTLGPLIGSFLVHSENNANLGWASFVIFGISLSFFMGVGLKLGARN